jgi:hypothetical protein
VSAPTAAPPSPAPHSPYSPTSSAALDSGAHAAHQLLEDIASGATLDRHASDQIIPFAALAAGTSSFRVPLITEHTETGSWLASVFLGADVRAEGQTLVISGQGSPHFVTSPGRERGRQAS